MHSKHRLVEFGINHPRLIVAAMVVLTIILGALIPAVKVDTDPENMLSEDEAVRVFHDRMKTLFDLNDMVVLGVVNETDPDGVFNPQSLARIHELTHYAITELNVEPPSDTHRSAWQLLVHRYGRLRELFGQEPPAPQIEPALVQRNIISPSVVDNVEPGSPGEVRMEFLMKEPPKTRDEARAIRDRIVPKAERPDAPARNPILYGTMVSEDGKAICIYLPLVSKRFSHSVYQGLLQKIATFSGDERYYITGLPVAEDTFGVEMFKQMAVSAPTAMGVIFLLMLLFFRKLLLIVSPMILAVVSVICTMGLLIGTGHTVHIMSSMIPIFIMPIAVLDSIHILSEFFDRYQATRNRRATIVAVMDELFMPMLYTSLTSAAGFGSLALTPIPPVQTFGIFVAIGVMLAWVLTVTFIPAYVMLLNDARFENFGAMHHHEGGAPSRLSRLLARLGRLTYDRAKPIAALTALLAAVAAYGITRININDNPVKWFTPSHPIRTADRVLNEHFAGTYLAYLVLEPLPPNPPAAEFVTEFIPRLEQQAAAIDPERLPKVRQALAELIAEARRLAADGTRRADALLAELQAFVQVRQDKADNDADDDAYNAWSQVRDWVTEEELLITQPMMDPALLRHIERLQKALAAGGLVGKSTSVADIVKTVHRDMFEGDAAQYRIPDSRRAISNVLFQFQSGHRPHDLFHMVTPDYKRCAIWVQLKTGDNRDMAQVVRAVEAFFENSDEPAPMPIRYRADPAPDDSESPHEQRAGWFGLTYINVVWQNKMVTGMMMSFLGSFLVVFLMMIVLYRSALWGLLSMIPLTVTIALIYGMVGFLGIDYDMPIAVLSSLTLGLAVDFAIHFLARSRQMAAELGSWDATAEPVFGEPARAITRNIIVIAVGFLPLLAAPLMPYKTVGIFLATILAVSGVGTLIILPALVTLLKKRLFADRRHPLACYCGTCVVAGLTAVAVVVVNVWHYLNVGITTMTWASLVLVPVLFGLCCMMSRRQACAARPDKTNEEEASNE